MLSDNFTYCDQLGRDKWLTAIGDRIHTCTAPAVFGVSGDWGSGKTSFLRRLQYYLTGDRDIEGVAPAINLAAHDAHADYTVVWFEAWRYQHEPQPVVALLYEICQQLSFKAKAKSEAKKIFEVVVKGALSLFEISVGGIKLAGFGKIQEIGEKVEAGRFQTPLTTVRIRQELQQAINALLGIGWLYPDEDPSKKLIVMIDDLDRCSPASTYALLEGLKIYLNLDRCVFVLGMNQQTVEDAIAEHYKDTKEDRAQIAHEYVEKICQNIWHLPVVGQSRDPNGKSFLRLCLDEIERPKAADAQAANRTVFFDSVSNLPSVESYIGENPRRLKAFANLLDRMFDCDPAAPQEKDQKRHATIAVVFGFLYLHCQEIYRQLQARPAEFYKDILLPWCLDPRDPRASDHPAMAGLRPTDTPGGLNVVVRDAGFTDDAKPTPGTVPLQSRYADPARGRFLRVQSLIADLGDLEEQEIRRYLLQ